ncbi:MAG: acetylornithine/succinylornithine family transaminase [Eubacteriales bacterium]|nr:acetylornithine/succinylornithine family transaminase [Eubacteriales bacterium]
MTNQDVIQLTNEYILGTYKRFPVALDRGEGATLTDFDGKTYLDFASGIGVCSLGYGNDRWVEAIARQAKKLPHTSNLYYTEPVALVAKSLCERTGMKGAFFSNSGAEANEGAIKLARKYSFDRYGAGRNRIVTLYHSFHGRTVTTLAATGQDVFHQYFFPFTEGFLYAEPNDFESVRNTCDKSVCAVMMELIQGEGGVLPLEKSFVQQVAAFCKENDILLIVDEVQTGVGRTGTLFCYQQYGVEPDVVTFAKGIAAGLPFGGVLAAKSCSGVLTPGTHATTFGGNPICAAGATVVLDTLTPEFLADVTGKGAYIRAQIAGWSLPVVSSVRGLGLMIGVGVTCSHRDAVVKLLAGGLLALTAGEDTIRLMPPLAITKDEIDAGLAILKQVLSACETK